MTCVPTLGQGRSIQCCEFKLCHPMLAFSIFLSKQRNISPCFCPLFSTYELYDCIWHLRLLVPVPSLLDHLTQVILCLLSDFSFNPIQTTYSFFSCFCKYMPPLAEIFFSTNSFQTFSLIHHIYGSFWPFELPPSRTHTRASTAHSRLDLQSFIKDVLDWNAYKQVFEKISLVRDIILVAIQLSLPVIQIHPSPATDRPINPKPNPKPNLT